MKLCISCSETLNNLNTYERDPRYCKQCAEQRTDFLKGRRLALYSLRSLPLDAKISKTKQMIRETVCEFGLDKVYISYSAGKDSTVLSHIAKELYPNILHIFANTTCEFPETIEHINWEKSQNSTNIITVLPKNGKGNIWTFKDVVDYYGYPMFSKRVANAIRTYRHAKFDETKQHSIDYIKRNFKKYDKYKELNISDKCCEILKKNPIKKKAKELGLECAILGLLAEESRQREQEWLNYGCNVFHVKKDNQSRPLSFWTEHDIYEYIERFNVKIPSLYKKGYSRNGCMYCGFGVHLEPNESNRFIRLKSTHPVQYNYFIKNFGDLMIEIGISH